MKLLLTGASGFIGRHVAAQLSRTGGCEVLAASRHPEPPSTNIRPVAIDLLDSGAVRRLVATERPTHMLHLAWNAKPGHFWTAQDNLDWTAASLLLQRAFQDAGGERLVVAGTCAEYDWSSGRLLNERATPLRPATLYGTAKDALRRLLLHPDASAGHVAWGRIFWLYGPGEVPNRLVSEIADALVSGRKARCSAGTHERDFLYVADVAAAFIAALRSTWSGVFNVGSGIATPVREVAGLLAEVAGRPDLLQLGGRPSPSAEPPALVADITILRDEIGFVPRYDLRTGLIETYDWWRHRLKR